MTRTVACLGVLATTLLPAAPALAQGSCPYPLHGVWELTFSAAQLTHEATLKMNGCTGIMHVAFYRRSVGRRAEISQRMTVSSTARGLRISGSNPVFKGTQRRDYGYNADNLFYEVNPYGRTTFQNCDDAGQCSPVEIVSERIAVSIRLRNRCDVTIDVAVLYRTPDDRWLRRGWWNVRPSQLVTTDAATLSQYIYFYAEGGGHTWSGANSSNSLSRYIVNHAFTQEEGGTLYGSRRRTVSFLRKSVDLNGETYTQSFSCD